MKIFNISIEGGGTHNAIAQALAAALAGLRTNPGPVDRVTARYLRQQVRRAQIEGGPAAVNDMAKEHKLRWDYCPTCDENTPTIATFKSCNCAVCNEAREPDISTNNTCNGINIVITEIDQ